MTIGQTGFAKTDICEVAVGPERIDSMDPSLEAMHPLDPPPPDVLLALLARNKTLEGMKNTFLCSSFDTIIDANLCCMF